MQGAHGAALLVALAVFSLPARAQTASPDTTPLAFRGVPAGVALGPLDATVRRLGGEPLRCLRSSRDRSVQECRSTLPDSATGLRLELWLSAIDSLSGIITFKAEGSSRQLGQWRSHLEQRYGRVPVNVQGPQRMLQWVRRGRMIRLTWRPEGPRVALSVSLVDGRVLDAWGSRKAP